MSSHSAYATRLTHIDALRGLVMVIMLLDHIRETIYLHYQVSDPMDAATTDPALFFTRVASMICAPVFVALTGLSAWLYGQNHSKAEVSVFLLKRGLFLMLLEVTVVGFAWSGQIMPTTFWLQVIWAIGVSMIALAALIHLPRTAQIATGLLIVCGHNLLDGIRLSETSALFVPWALLHQRDIIDLGGGLIAKTTYPVLPWVGVMVLGYALGPWFGKAAEPRTRQRYLLQLGIGMIIAFVALRFTNLYGDQPWAANHDPLRTIMSFMALTKYPPSLLYLLPTLGVGLVALSIFERLGDRPGLRQLAILGGAPMFFYLLHLLVLKGLYVIGLNIWGANQGQYFGASTLWPVWALWPVLIAGLYWPSKWFSELKKRRRDLSLLRYF